MRSSANIDREQPTVQVIERIFAILDVLAAHSEPMPLKTISERT
ncbi:MAG: helix-turn-helix domain-containing protein, partial [Betaproteobacteria bacterium]|nr:helix-turn-helix domain-containing protein [Betaproteobacteria bacterium]